MQEKVITSIIQAQEIIEGAGAQVKRSIGGPYLSNYDPFVLLDEFTVTPPASFPYHSHRGFEAVTYMLRGAFRHEDKEGNSGVITQGDIQLMNTGRGIRHTEMPYTEYQNRGFQLWVNLPKRLKQIDPSYQLVEHKSIPNITEDGFTICVLLGEYKGQASPGKLHTPVLFLDIIIEPAPADRTYPYKPGIRIPADYQAFLYAYEGQVTAGEEEQTISAGELALLGQGDTIHLFSRHYARLILVAGKPHNEPIVQHGPFVD